MAFPETRWGHIRVFFEQLNEIADIGYTTFSCNILNGFLTRMQQYHCAVHAFGIDKMSKSTAVFPMKKARKIAAVDLKSLRDRLQTKITGQVILYKRDNPPHIMRITAQ